MEVCVMEFNLDKDAPIGVMDSGMGGISVLRELVKLLPHENFIFYGDSANAPYGSRSTENIYELTENVVQKLIAKGVKGVVIACNTASSAAGRRLREEYPQLPIVAIEPALKPAVIGCPNGRVVVLATEATLREKNLPTCWNSGRARQKSSSCLCQVCQSLWSGENWILLLCGNFCRAISRTWGTNR